jgi:hypothetical protein
LFVGQDDGIRDRFDQCGAKYGCGHAEDHIIGGQRRDKVPLRDTAADGVAPSADREQCLYASVAAAVRFELEARFPHGPVPTNK